MTVAESQQKVNLKASSNVVLIPHYWSFRGEYSQDKSEMGKFAWKLTNFIKRDGNVKIRRSSRENRMIRQRFRFKLGTHDNLYRDGKVARPSRRERLGSERRDSSERKEGEENDQHGGAIGHGRMSGIVGDDLNKMVLTT
ncbi:uncharacterized protein TNCV_1289491 [Trichonephila clavipes]|nr:uncharacterized protein TNCV_1289491 [Trichonephila clavipes]